MATKKKPAAKKSNAGRKTKYLPKYCEELIYFFATAPYREQPEITTFKDGTTKETYKEVPNNIPLFQSFAHQIDVHVDTLHEWKAKYPEFSEAYKRAKQLQESFLVQNGLRGNYATPFAIFTAKNILGWRDVQHIEETKTVSYQDFADREEKKRKDREQAKELADEEEWD